MYMQEISTLFSMEAISFYYFINTLIFFVSFFCFVLLFRIMLDTMWSNFKDNISAFFGPCSGRRLEYVFYINFIFFTVLNNGVIFILKYLNSNLLGLFFIHNGYYFLFSKYCFLQIEINDLENKKSVNSLIFYKLFIFEELVLIKLNYWSLKLNTFLNSLIYKVGYTKKDATRSSLNLVKIIHNFIIELYWTILPGVAILCSSSPSIAVMFFEEVIMFIANTVRIIANQWFWTAGARLWMVEDLNIASGSLRISSSLITKIVKQIKEVKDPIVENSNSSFEAVNENDSNNSDDICLINTNDDLSILDINMTPNVDLLMSLYDMTNRSTSSIANPSLVMQNLNLEPQGIKRLLDTETAIPIPLNLITRYTISSNDVAHAYCLPNFCLKIDALPGRLTETVHSINKLGIYYGQCSELCGPFHAFMPVTIIVI